MHVIIFTTLAEYCILYLGDHISITRLSLNRDYQSFNYPHFSPYRPTVMLQCLLRECYV
jgi:hypothetical protein